jgi:hypothetical protein
VKENKNIYPPHKKKIKNTYLVDNYVEVAGIISTMRAGITPESRKREVAGVVGQSLLPIKIYTARSNKT